MLFPLTETQSVPQLPAIPIKLIPYRTHSWSVFLMPWHLPRLWFYIYGHDHLFSVSPHSGASSTRAGYLPILLAQCPPSLVSSMYWTFSTSLMGERMVVILHPPQILFSSLVKRLLVSRRRKSAFVGGVATTWTESGGKSQAVSSL